jgi:hypothetical protein
VASTSGISTVKSIPVSCCIAGEAAKIAGVENAPNATVALNNACFPHPQALAGCRHSRRTSHIVRFNHRAPAEMGEWLCGWSEQRERTRDQPAALTQVAAIQYGSGSPPHGPQGRRPPSSDQPPDAPRPSTRGSTRDPAAAAPRLPTFDRPAAASNPTPELSPKPSPPPAANKKVKLSFKLPYRVDFGQDICIVGSSDALGNWDPRKGVAMRWSEGDTWEVDFEVTAG